MVSPERNHLTSLRTNGDDMMTFVRSAMGECACAGLIPVAGQIFSYFVNICSGVLWYHGTLSLILKTQGILVRDQKYVCYAMVST